LSRIATVKVQALHIDREVFFECAQLSVVNRFTPNWNAEPAYGKMDPIATYANTSRTVDIDFTVFGKQIDTSKSLQSNADLLVKLQYPKYQESQGGLLLAGPPVFKVSVLDNKLYSIFQGYFTSFGITPGSSQGVPPLYDGNRFYERQYEFALGMQVLHSYVPGWIGGNDPGGSEGLVFTGLGNIDENAENIPAATSENGITGDGPANMTSMYAEENISGGPQMTMAPEDEFNPAALGGGTNSAKTPEDRESLSEEGAEQFGQIGLSIGDVVSYTSGENEF